MTYLEEAIRDFQEHFGETDELLHLWKCIIAFEDVEFITSGRGRNHMGAMAFTYEISRVPGSGGKHYDGADVPGYGNEMWIFTADGMKPKSISRSTVDLGYKKALELMALDGFVKGPRALGIPGARSYLYPIFVRFGIIRRTNQ